MKFNKGEYSFLALFCILYITIIFSYQTNSAYMLMATVGFTITYLIWGIIHHLRIKNFTWRIMLEYFLVAILGVAIVSTLLI